MQIIALLGNHPSPDEISKLTALEDLEDSRTSLMAYVTCHQQNVRIWPPYHYEGFENWLL